MKNKIFILLDRSGSMNSMWNEALGGINGYIKKFQHDKAYLDDTDVMLAVFDSVGYDVIRNTTANEWKDVTVEEVQPRGGTPLLDASARIMHNMIDSGAKRAILVVVTDGDENQSTKYKKSDVIALTKHVTEKLDYEMVFLGANFDKVAEVAQTNYAYNDLSRSVISSPHGFATAMNATATCTASYFSVGKTASFYDEKTKAEVKQ
jgi:uncharacterized protein YegL